MKWTLRFSATLAALLVLGGCDAGEEAERTAPASGADRGADTAAAVEPDREGAPLSAINRSTVQGTAAVVRESGEAEVRLDVQGLEPGLRYSAHVHEGRCATGGPIRLPLGRVTADEDGAGALRMRVAGDRLPGSGLFVQVHAPTGEPVACADVDGPESTP